MRAGQKGFATVEFALVGLVLLVIIFAAMELGRLLFTYSVLNEGMRRGARVAAVCPVNDPAIRSAAAFADLPGFTTANVSVAYLDQNGATIANPAGSFATIRYVQLQVTGYQHQLLIPMVFTSITVPAFRAILPRESLGVVNGVSTSC
jgi:Flp pilus assembly protein TadG